MSTMINRFLFSQIIGQRLIDKDEEQSSLPEDCIYPFLSMGFSESFAQLESCFEKGRLRESLYLLRGIEEVINEGQYRRKLPYEAIQQVRKWPLQHLTGKIDTPKLFQAYGELGDAIKQKLHKSQRSWGRMDEIMAKERKQLSARFLFNGVLASNQVMIGQRDALLLGALQAASEKSSVFQQVLDELGSIKDIRVYVKKLSEQEVANPDWTVRLPIPESAA